MSLGVQFTGTIRPQPVDEPGAALRAVERWFRENCESTLRDLRSTDDDSPALVIDLHPAAEALRIVLKDSNRIVLSAQTSAAGPGYHIFVCNLLVRIAEALDIDWTAAGDDEGDETGYFGTSEPNLVYQEMLAWLGKLCEVLLGESSTEDANLAVAMPVGVTFEAGEYFITQMGPRSRAWVESVAREPERGKDFFAGGTLNKTRSITGIVHCA